MAQANVFYKGDEEKFAINLQAEGFSMDTDDFDITVRSKNVSVSLTKTGEPVEGVWSNEDGSLIVFKEEGTGGAADVWYCIVDTKDLDTGDLTVIATAHIPDANANDGVRDLSDVKTLGTLKAK